MTTQPMNIPFTHKQVKSIRLGFNRTATGPNRKARRAHFQKQAHNPAFGAMVTRFQNVINHKTGTIKTFVHFHHLRTLN